jgi:hypothetical protein
MALSETAKLFVNLSLTGDFVSKMGKANKSLSTFEASSNRAYRAGQQIGTGIKNAGKIAAVGVGLLVSQVGFGLWRRRPPRPRRSSSRPVPPLV